MRRILASTAALVAATAAWAGSPAAGPHAIPAARTAAVPEAIAVPEEIAMPLAAGYLPELGGMRVGRPVEARVYALGGEGAARFLLVSGTLPKGLALAADGRLDGAPDEAGRSRAVVAVEDRAGQRAEVAVEVEVAPAEAVR